MLDLSEQDGNMVKLILSCLYATDYYDLKSYRLFETYTMHEVTAGS